MWAEQKEKEKFIEEFMNDIAHDSRLDSDLKYKLQRMGEREIKQNLYKILNRILKPEYPVSRSALYNEETKNTLKTRFLSFLRDKY